jgi:hypothetical protein
VVINPYPDQECKNQKRQKNFNLINKNYKKKFSGVFGGASSLTPTPVAGISPEMWLTSYQST